MGFHNIKLITRKLMNLGKRRDYPCAVISKEVHLNKKVVVGTLETIVELSKICQHLLLSLLEVVTLRDKIKWF